MGDLLYRMDRYGTTSGAMGIDSLGGTIGVAKSYRDEVPTAFRSLEAVSVMLYVDFSNHMDCCL